MTTSMNSGSRASHTYPIWDLSVGNTPWNFLDPMIDDFPIIGRESKIVGMGCCFVRHMLKYLLAAGYPRYLVEPHPGKEIYFSARHDFINSARQLSQLFQQSFEMIDIPDQHGIWQHDNGTWIDVLRADFADPQTSVENVRTKRREHFVCMQRVFKEADVIIFTAAVSEYLFSKSTGLAYPASAGSDSFISPIEDMIAVNSTVSEIITHLDEFISGLRSINPDIKVILSVSPMSLVATQMRRQHALLANCYGKSALRAAFQEICDRHEEVFYFPAYELIYSPHTAGRFYENNLREISASGISFVMRLFIKHFCIDEHDEEHRRLYSAPDNYTDALCAEGEATLGAIIVDG